MTADIDREKLRELCEHVKEYGSSNEIRVEVFKTLPALLDLTDAQAEKIEELEAAIEGEIHVRELAYELVRDCASALGNGAFISPECSDEFHAQVPTEIAKCVSALRDRIASLESERDELRKQVEGQFIAGMRKAAEIANDTYETYNACSDWDYGAQNACVALERAILSEASALEQKEQG